MFTRCFRSTLLVLFCCAVSAHAQMPKALNYYLASPEQYQLRVATVIQHDSQIDSIKYTDDGRIAGKETYSVEVDTSGAELVVTVGSKISSLRYSYAPNGYLAEIQEFHYPTSSTGETTETLVQQEFFQRNEAGYLQLYEQHMLDDNDQVIKPFTKTDYSYNEKGQLTKMQHYAYDIQENNWYSLRTASFTYNQAGAITSLVAKDGDAMIHSEEISYDKDGKILQVLLTDAQSGESLYQYGYDKNGNIVSSKKTSGEIVWFDYQAEYDHAIARKTTFVPRLEFGTAQSSKFLDAFMEFHLIPYGFSQHAIKTIHVKHEEELQPERRVTYEVNDAKSTGSHLLEGGKGNLAVSYSHETITLLVDPVLEGQKYTLYSASGDRLVQGVLQGGELLFMRNSYPKGVLLLQTPSGVVKLVN